MAYDINVIRYTYQTNSNYWHPNHEPKAQAAFDKGLITREELTEVTDPFSPHACNRIKQKIEFSTLQDNEQSMRDKMASLALKVIAPITYMYHNMYKAIDFSYTNSNTSTNGHFIMLHRDGHAVRFKFTMNARGIIVKVDSKAESIIALM